MVYLIGKWNRVQLGYFHHTKQYQQDFELIAAVVELFPKVYTTPNVLTEVSNLGQKAGGDFLDTLRAAIQRMEERYCLSSEAASVAPFQKLGLTDSGLC